MSPPFGKAFVILNRRAGKGARHPEEFEKALAAAGLDFEMHVTTRRHHAVELARQAIDDGWTYLVAVGGDGTIHEVVNGMMGTDGPRNPEAVLGVVSAGSGADFARTFGLPDDTDAMIPMPTAMTTPMNIQIGAMRARTPLCHNASPTPRIRTKYPMRNTLINLMTVPRKSCSGCSGR